MSGNKVKGYPPVLDLEDVGVMLLDKFSDGRMIITGAGDDEMVHFPKVDPEFADAYERFAQRIVMAGKMYEALRVLVQHADLGVPLDTAHAHKLLYDFAWPDVLTETVDVDA